MKVNDIMIKEVIVLHASDTYKDAARLFTEKNITGAPVVDEAGKVIGILSEKDLLKVLYPFYQSYYNHPELYLNKEEREQKIKEIFHDPISKFMSNNVISCKPEIPIMEAAATMLAKGIHRLVVLEGDKLAGIITRSDIYHQILKNSLNNTD